VNCCRLKGDGQLLLKEWAGALDDVGLREACKLGTCDRREVKCVSE
jgi:hypothetical protein